DRDVWGALLYAGRTEFGNWPDGEEWDTITTVHHDPDAVTCDRCAATSESGWGDQPTCLSCTPPEYVCTEHSRTFVAAWCPLCAEESAAWHHNRWPMTPIPRRPWTPRERELLEAVEATQDTADDPDSDF